MDRAESLFLSAFRAAVRNEDLFWNELPEQDILRRLFRLAMEQNVLPLVAEAIASKPAFRNNPIVQAFLRRARSLTLSQAARTGDFLLLLEKLRSLGLQPLILKGLICRSMYPQPEQRLSTDEDLLIPAAEFPRYHEALLSCGLRLQEPDRSLEGEDEITYVDPDRDLYLELHLRPFPSYEEAYGDCNRFFEDVFSRESVFSVYGRSVSSLSCSDHLLYLILHAYKHLLYGGVGVRQICDICLFAERFSSRIDWQRLHAACEDCGITDLSAAFFLVGERHFGIPCPAAFRDPEIDELPLLDDCLSGGVYGAEDEDRLHSSNMTLEAVAAGKQGRADRTLWKSLFPTVKYLQDRFPYARTHVWLLPVAWAQRLWLYVFRGRGNASKSLRIGRRRIELLRRYRIIP